MFLHYARVFYICLVTISTNVCRLCSKLIYRAQGHLREQKERYKATLQLLLFSNQKKKAENDTTLEVSKWFSIIRNQQESTNHHDQIQFLRLLLFGRHQLHFVAVDWAPFLLSRIDQLVFEKKKEKLEKAFCGNTPKHKLYPSVNLNGSPFSTLRS